MPQICHWLEERDFERSGCPSRTAGLGVGAHRFNGEPQPLSPGASMFTFVGYDALARADGHQLRS
jgi:hypothetical protein